MRKLRQQFVDSSKEMKNLNTLVLTALFIAIGIVLGQFSIQVTQDVKVGISFVATQLTATLFGCLLKGGGTTSCYRFLNPFLQVLLDLVFYCCCINDHKLHVFQQHNVLSHSLGDQKS